MAARSRGLGISSKDMEASRLVFVFLKDSKPRRKVAIPVPDSYTWDQFLTQVKSKLKLTGIAEIYLSATGKKVTTVTELQDIDELCVVEGPPEPIATSNGNSLGGSQRAAADLGETAGVAGGTSVVSPSSTLRQPSLPQERHKVVISTDGLMPSTSASFGGDADDADKYARRAHPLKRTLQRLFPNAFAPGLPVTARDAQLDSSADGGVSSKHGGRRRRRARSPYNVRNLLLVLVTMSCVLTMLYLFFWVSSSPAMAGLQTGGMPVTGQAAVAAGGGGGGGSAAADGGGGGGQPAAQPAAGDAAAGAGSQAAGAAGSLTGDAKAGGAAAATGGTAAA